MKFSFVSLYRKTRSLHVYGRYMICKIQIWSEKTVSTKRSNLRSNYSLFVLFDQKVRSKPVTDMKKSDFSRQLDIKSTGKTLQFQI